MDPPSREGQIARETKLEMTVALVVAVHGSSFLENAPTKARERVECPGNPRLDTTAEIECIRWVCKESYIRVCVTGRADELALSSLKLTFLGP